MENHAVIICFRDTWKSSISCALVLKWFKRFAEGEEGRSRGRGGKSVHTLTEMFAAEFIRGHLYKIVSFRKHVFDTIKLFLTCCIYLLVPAVIQQNISSCLLIFSVRDGSMLILWL